MNILTVAIDDCSDLYVLNYLYQSQNLCLLNVFIGLQIMIYRNSMIYFKVIWNIFDVRHHLCMVIIMLIC